MDATKDTLQASKEIIVINMAGNEVTRFGPIDVAKTTGWDMKQTIAELTGFASVSIQLRFVDDEIKNSSTLVEVLKPDHMNDACITVACVFAPSRAWGKKHSGQRLYFGSKAGMSLERRLVHERPNIECASISKSPNVEFVKLAKELIQKSFAPGLASLIEMGVNVASQKYNACEGAFVIPDRTPCLYEDVSGAYADLSSCELWTRTVHLTPLIGRLQSPLVCALLYRLLPTWKGDSPIENGPVLEVLFLATGPDFREMRVAKQLVNELEATAKTMGCIAVSVAAVPKQGMSFWTGCGYEVHVPLLEPTGPDSSPPGLGEPVTPFGHFLLANMMLFTDTPLVAKMIVDAPNSCADGDEEVV